ncbi:MAG: GNAT family N-acetyltransferase [Chitinophagaceae bacterium]
MNENKLDNPVWHSLNEVHKQLAVGTGGIRFYHPDYCPFGGFISEENIADRLDEYAAQCTNFYVVGQNPVHHPSLQLNKELVCDQMILQTPVITEDTTMVVKLQPENSEELFRLVNLVQPGYFKNKTSNLGSYFGIYRDGELVAVTGERMKMDGYTEVSAVVTHPAHTGKGYAKKLVAYTTDCIFKENKIPYLHVAATNVGAIKLYEKLGFTTRRKISFWNFIKG